VLRMSPPRIVPSTVCVRDERDCHAGRQISAVVAGTDG
jgi:hypothetical protein